MSKVGHWVRNLLVPCLNKEMTSPPFSLSPRTPKTLSWPKKKERRTAKPIDCSTSFETQTHMYDPKKETGWRDRRVHAIANCWSGQFTDLQSPAPPRDVRETGRTQGGHIIAATNPSMHAGDLVPWSSLLVRKSLELKQ